ncbi:aspartic proteinase Mkc7p [[Candida] railenensis]|uniref:candidapepsin n=1 Tax=[Candida] railenensis TaxID=45579 RepID=A0A9P0QQA2_9ASCO|nr:aspartic proteinase Mkc7p [[Candida] railenensis]
MLSAYKILIFLSTLTKLTDALDTSSPLLLNFEVHRGDSDNEMSIHNKLFFEKRADDDGKVDMKLTNDQVMYITTLKVGSNEDEVKVQIDTGSSDLYVMTPDVDCYYYSYSYRNKRTLIDIPTYFKRANSEACTSYGSFDYKKSTSFKKTEDVEEFYIAYMDNTDSAGFYGSDKMQVGDATLETAYFAVANESSTNSGVFGIGFRGRESAYYYSYENIPLRLKSEGFIKKNAYSLFLNSENQTTGSVLFGAVDHAKYSGPLTSIPIVNSTEEYSSLSSLLYGIDFYAGGEGGSNDTYSISSSTYQTLFDSGSTLSVMPADLIYRFGESLGGYYSSEGYYAVPCSNSEDVYFTFDFGGAKIKVPLSSLLIPSKSSTTKCYLGLMENVGEYIVLGDNVLRSMYVVYDLDDLSISLAQAKYTNDTDIEEIGSDGGIPSATKAATYAANSYDYSTIYESSVTAVATYATGRLPDEDEYSSYSYTAFDSDYYYTLYNTYDYNTDDYDSYLSSLTEDLYSTHTATNDYTTTRSHTTRSLAASSTSRISSTGSSSTRGSSAKGSSIHDSLSVKCFTLIFGILGTVFYF